MLWTDEELESPLRLDSVVTVGGQIPFLPSSTGSLSSFFEVRMNLSPIPGRSTGKALLHSKSNHERPPWEIFREDSL